MIEIRQSEEILYNLLTILCDMLASEETYYHEEIISEFIQTIELKGQPLRGFIEITLQHNHLHATLSHTLNHMPYLSQKKILEKMHICWPDDCKMISRLQDVAYIVHLRAKDQSLKTRLSHESLIHHLLLD